MASYNSSMIGRWGVITDRAVGLGCILLGLTISTGLARHDFSLAILTMWVATSYSVLIWLSHPISMAAAFFITLPVEFAAYTLCDIIPGDWTWNVSHETHESTFALVLFGYTFLRLAVLSILRDKSGYRPPPIVRKPQ